MVLLAMATLVFPHIFSMYQTNIMISALIYVMLGLGLNIVIGLAGLLDLGYVAFFARGGHMPYALLNLHFGLTFWMVLPIGGLLGGNSWGLSWGIPCSGYGGDYLAIVTLGFGEIIRLVLEKLECLFQGPQRYCQYSQTWVFRDGSDTPADLRLPLLYYCRPWLFSPFS